MDEEGEGDDSTYSENPNAAEILHMEEGAGTRLTGSLMHVFCQEISCVSV